jgi:hypothetical protein
MILSVISTLANRARLAIAGDACRDAEAALADGQVASKDIRDKTIEERLGAALQSQGRPARES